MKLEWNGDVDLNDGKLQAMYLNYQRHRTMIDGIGSGSRKEDLEMCNKQMSDDLTFISNGMCITMYYTYTNCIYL